MQTSFGEQSVLSFQIEFQRVVFTTCGIFVLKLIPEDLGLKKLQSKPTKTDTEGVIESVRINGVSV